MRNLSHLNRLAWITSIGMFLVVVMGALVTKTDSGRGCGNDWPLCNGKFIPDHTISSLIEYSHRFVTGIEALFVLAAYLLVRVWMRNREAHFYAASALFFTIVQALLGAAAVKWPQSAPVLALHFGFSLLAFVSTLLLAFMVRSKMLSVTAAAEPADDLQNAGMVPAVQSNVSVGMRRAVYWTIGYCYVVVYFGALVKHTHSSGGCAGWPLCNGEFIPQLSGATLIVFIHRVAALLLFILIAIVAYYAEKRFKHVASAGNKRIRTAARWSFYLVCTQVITGGIVTFSITSDWYLTTGMLHVVTITCLFGALCYLGMLVWRKQEE